MLGRYSPLAGVVLAAALATSCGSDPPAKPIPTGDPPPPAGFEPPEPSMRRLLARQYTHSVRDLLGEDAALVAMPPADSSINGYEAIAASQLALNDTSVTEYELSARAVATAAMGDDARIAELLDCSPEGPSDASCHRSFVQRFGRLAFRRSLTDDELEDYVGLAQSAATELGDFHAGVEFVILAMLQSPHFLFQVELGEHRKESVSYNHLTGYEVASRMSFFMLDTTPAEWMLDAAEAGELDTAAGVREVARQLLEEPAARDAMQEFFSEYLDLRDLPSMTKQASEYPTFTTALAESMQSETLRLLDYLIWQAESDFGELFDADYTFVDARLAELYGMPAPEGGGWERMTLPPKQLRGGLLGHASFLAGQSHATTTSPTHRGIFVLERLMCMSIPAPPSDVNVELPPSSQAPTMRERLEVHMEDPSCAGCHAIFDPIGLGLENFDAIGAFRTKENGATIDAQSELPGLGEFAGAAELGASLRASEDVMRCVVQNAFRHATGHVETQGEQAGIDVITEGFRDSGYRFQDLLVELVASEAFRAVGEIE